MATETLRPNAAGDEENIPTVVGDGVGAHYTTVDEETPDEDTSYVGSGYADDTWYRDLYNVAGHSEGSGTINHIKVYARCYTPTASPVQAGLKIAIKSGTGTGDPDTVDEGSEEGLTNSYADYFNQWSTNPATGSAWTWDEIDKLQIGISLRRTKDSSWGKSRCTQVYVEVDYTAVTSKTSSDAGSGVDALYSLETPEAKSSSDTGSGIEGAPVQSAALIGNETGSGIEALVARLLAAVDTGYGVEAGNVEIEGLLKDLFASELGLGSDSLIAKIETPTKGGGMKLWN